MCDHCRKLQQKQLEESIKDFFENGFEQEFEKAFEEAFKQEDKVDKDLFINMLYIYVRDVASCLDSYYSSGIQEETISAINSFTKAIVMFIEKAECDIDIARLMPIKYKGQ